MTRRPVILAHGIARFDELPRLFGANLYFKGVAEALRENGFQTVVETHVDYAGEVQMRGQQLASQIAAVCDVAKADSVQVIAHSMGGLDARWAIATGRAPQVFSLTTIGTPHLGTPFADVGVDAFADVIPLAATLGVQLGGFADLTVQAARTFDALADVEAENDVRYCTYSSHQSRWRTLDVLKPSWQLIHERTGEPSDGLVPVSSQAWKSALISSSGQQKRVDQRGFPFAADHLNQTGWWHPTPLAAALFWHRFPGRVRYERAVRQLYVTAALDAEAAAAR